MLTVQEIVKIAEKYCGKADMAFAIPVAINPRLSTTVGRVAFLQEGDQLTPTRMEFSKKFLAEATPEEIEQVIAHECAHYIAAIRSNQSHGHDAYFKAICREIGCTNDTAATYVEPPADYKHKYEITCGECGKALGGYSRMCKTLKYVKAGLGLCPHCGSRNLTITQNW